MKEDRYEFPTSEWMFAVKEEEPREYIIYRKKPKVKVDARIWNLCEQAHHFCEYGYYYIVQFRVTECLWDKDIAEIDLESIWVRLSSLCIKTKLNASMDGSKGYLDIGLDARDKWSAPVLLPESIYSRLDEITKALEDRANGGKG